MKKIDWYILKKFLGTFLYAMIIFIVISVVIDITEKLDDFVSQSVSMSSIIGYYMAFIPYISALLFPLFIFISVIFFTSKMAYQSEIIAILGSGVSFNRMLRPYWVGAIFLGLLLSVSNHFIVPRANQVRIAFENKYVNNKQGLDQVNNFHLRIDSDSYVSMFNYDPNYKSAYGFTLEKIKGQDLFYKLEVQRLDWDSSKKAWKTNYGIVREINGLHEQVRTITKDTLLKLHLSPNDMIPEKNLKDAMTTPQLNRFIAQQKLRGAGGLNFLYVEKYGRTASGFAVIILTLIGVVIASRKIRGGSGLHLALGIVISSAYILFMQFSTTFSTKGNLDPLLAVWIPNILFAILAFFLYRQAPK
ncbi:MAG: LptF/LptG family permease [Chitinophagaceae bacterium]